MSSFSLTLLRETKKHSKFKIALNLSIEEKNILLWFVSNFWLRIRNLEFRVKYKNIIPEYHIFSFKLVNDLQKSLLVMESLITLQI